MYSRALLSSGAPGEFRLMWKSDGAAMGRESTLLFPLGTRLLSVFCPARIAIFIDCTVQNLYPAPTCTDPAPNESLSNPPRIEARALTSTCLETRTPTLASAPK